MAKIAFTKLALKRNNDIKIVEWNGQKIEVKQFLPTEEKLDLIARIISFSADDHAFYNPCKIEIFEKIWVLLAYTNISLTDKQSEDVLKLYDLFVSSGFLVIIEENIPETELSYIHMGVVDTITEIYRYKTSAQGVMEAIVNDYKDVELDANKIAETIAGQGNLETVKKVITELG